MTKELIALTTIEEEREGRFVKFPNGTVFTPESQEKSDYYTQSGYARIPTEEEAALHASNRQSTAKPAGGTAEQARGRGHMRRDFTARR